MKRVILVLAFIGVVATNSVFAQLEIFDELLPMIFVEGNDKIADFYIGKFEVTQEAWIAIMGYNHSYNKVGGSYPVDNLSYIKEFLFRLSSLTGRNYRLPTSAEWLFAAQGGKQSRGYRYSGSDNINDVAWYNENSRGLNDTSSTHPVGRKQPNELGIYDMSGNVWELSASNTIFGGSYLHSAKRSRIGSRRRVNQFHALKQINNPHRNAFIGFRVAYTTPDAQPVPVIPPASENIPPIVANTNVQPQPVIEIPPASENIPPIVASTNVQPVVETTEFEGIPINKGNSFINAQTTNFGIINVDGATAFILNVNMGHFVANRFALVGGLGFDLVSSDLFSENNLSLNAGFRYYWVKANNGGLFINSSFNVTKPNDLKVELGINAGAGYSFFLNNRVAFEPTVNFVMPFSEGYTNIFVFGCGFSIFF